MSVMRHAVDMHDSAQLYLAMQQCFKDVREVAVYAGDGAMQGRVEGVIKILNLSLTREWHQLRLVDEEGGRRLTFQQEIWGEVLRWQNAENMLAATEINSVFFAVKELIVSRFDNLLTPQFADNASWRRGEQAYDQHEFRRRAVVQAAWLDQRPTRAHLQQAYTHLQQSLELPGHDSGVRLQESTATLATPFSLQPVRSPRHTTPSTSYLSSTASSSLSPSHSPSRSSPSPLLVHTSDLVLHVSQEPRNIAPQVLHRSPRPRPAHSNNSPLPPHEPYADWQGNHDGTIGHNSFFNEAFHGLDPAASPQNSPASYGFHSLGRHSHKLTRMRP
ncbi:hypothetical protein JCM10296v2_002467 [Rhodotorula toruloides]